MRILAIEDELTLFRGGSERSYFDVLTGLQQAGHEVHLMYRSSGNLLPKYTEAKVHTFQREHSLLLRGGSKGADLKALWKSATYIIKHVQPDVIYLNFTEAIPLAAIVFLRARIPIVCHIRISYYGLTRQIKLAARLVSKFIVINQAFKPLYENALRATGKVDVVYNGITIPTNMPTPKVRSGKVLKVLYLGRIAREKGVVDLVEAVAHVIRLGHPVELQVTGAFVASYLGDFRAELKEVIEKEGIQQHVTVSDPTPDPVSYISQFDLFVFPSIWDEGFGRTVVESIVAGVPVLARDVGMVREMLAQNPSFIFSTTEELSSKLIAFAEGQLRFDLAASRDHVAKNFNKERMVHEVEQKLRAVVHS